jgi:hypothetical protein
MCEVESGKGRKTVMLEKAKWEEKRILLPLVVSAYRAKAFALTAAESAYLLLFFAVVDFFAAGLEAVAFEAVALVAAGFLAASFFGAAFFAGAALAAGAFLAVEAFEAVEDFLVVAIREHPLSYRSSGSRKY